MKFNKILPASVALFMLVTSCSKQLQEKPESLLSTTNFYKTKADAVAAVDAIYNPLRNEYGGTEWGGQFTAAEDYSYGTGIYAAIGQYVLTSSDIGRTDASWRNFYRSIRNANLVLKYVPPILMTDAERNAILGEARFLRALAYRNLVRSWGAVPLRTDPTENVEQVHMKRTPVAEVNAFIIEDLKFAETNLPNSQPMIGRPTKWSAKVFLADFYLYNEKWQEARDKADEVIKANIYSLVPVTKPSDFENIFGPTVQTHTEDVFSFKYSRANGGSQIAQQYAMPNSAYSENGYSSFYGVPTMPLLRDWDKNDLRYQFDVYTSYPNRSGAITPTSADRPLMFGKFKDAGFAPSHGNDFPIYRYPDALFIYAEADNQVSGGPTVLALERLNMVHRRAYGYSATAPSPVDFTIATAPTAQAFRDLVLRERAYEFLAEHKRWFDLVRTKTYKQVIKEAKGIDVPDKFLLFPIPQAEIDNNDEIAAGDQNPGY
jgi:hypothetical protein